jgi:hypothetical protein
MYWVELVQSKTILEKFVLEKVQIEFKNEPN